MDQGLPSAEQSYGCEYCSKTFSKRYNLNEHIKIHLPKTAYKCSHCSYATNFKRRYLMHYRLHIEDRPYKCPEPNCGWAFTTNSTLKAHKLVHSQKDESVRRFKCDVCPYQSVLLGNLKSHMKCHSKIKSFFCALCPFRAKLKSGIKSHLKFVHSNLRPYKCPQPNCSYRGKASSNLAQHLKVHSSERPFACSFSHCGFKTKYPQHLENHERTHSKKRTVLCPTCLSTNCPRSITLDGSVHRVSEVDPNCYTEGLEKMEGDVTSPNSMTMTSDVTHVKWSVDWGRIVNKIEGGLDAQKFSFLSSFIKVESDTMIL